MSGVLDWIAFQRVFGFGTVRAQTVLDAVGHPSELLNLSAGSLERLHLLLPKELSMASAHNVLLQTAALSLERAQKMGCTILTPESDGYPDRLRQLYSSPLVLYVLGSLEGIDDQPAIAMVGTRKYTDYGEKVAADLGFALADCGVAVVSGLAAGIDTISHKAALRAGGRTIAVLGCGPDIVYPAANRELHSTIIERGGAVVTEFPPTERALAFHFPIRNRIISGLSLGVVVVEGGRRSGSIITAGHAVTQNREVFAVPGSIYSPMSDATNWLITQGATIATCAQDILAQFPYISTRPPKNAKPKQKSFDIPSVAVHNDTVPTYLNQNQSGVLSALNVESATAESLLAVTGLPLHAILSSLTQLELFGLIESCAGRRFKRKQ